MMPGPIGYSMVAGAVVVLLAASSPWVPDFRNIARDAGLTAD